VRCNGDVGELFLGESNAYFPRPIVVASKVLTELLEDLHGQPWAEAIAPVVLG